MEAMAFFYPILRDIAQEQNRTLKYAAMRPITQVAQLKRTKAAKKDLSRKNVFPSLGVIFVHIPKTAGTSVHKWLTEAETSMGVDVAGDVERPESSKHAKAYEWCNAIGRDTWDRHFTFTLVRNPYDLMVSSYFWWLQKAIFFPQFLKTALYIRELGSFEKFMMSFYGRYCINEVPGEMSDWFSRGGQDLVNYVGRVENLENDMSRVLENSKIETFAPNLPKSNPSRRSSYRDYYTLRSRRVVEERFADIIERFNYKF